MEFVRRGPSQSIPAAIAERIAENADRNPSFLVAAAEARCKEITAKRIRPVARAAQEERWFEPE